MSLNKSAKKKKKKQETTLVEHTGMKHQSWLGSYVVDERFRQEVVFESDLEDRPGDSVGLGYR